MTDHQDLHPRKADNPAVVGGGLCSCPLLLLEWAECLCVDCKFMCAAILPCPEDASFQPALLAFGFGSLSAPSPLCVCVHTLSGVGGLVWVLCLWLSSLCISYIQHEEEV